MMTRRTFLGTAGAALIAPQIHAAEAAKKKLAVVTNVWTYKSHAWHMAERFLHGYPVEGKWHRPPVEVVSEPRLTGSAAGRPGRELPLRSETGSREVYSGH